jgi:hypothetical protein
MIPAVIAGVAALGSAAATYLGNKYAADKAAASRAAAAQKIGEMQSQSNQYYDQMYRDIGDYYDKRGSLGTANDAKDYKAAIGAYDPNDYVLNMEDAKNQFGYNKTADSFLNPYYDQIIGDTAATVQHTAAGAGLGRGSGAAQAIADAVVKKNEELYNDAYNRFTDDRQFEYNKYADYIANKQRQLSELRAATDTKLSMQGNLANDYYSAMDAKQSDLLKAQQDRQGTMATYAQAMMGVA